MLDADKDNPYREDLEEQADHFEPVGKNLDHDGVVSDYEERGPQLSTSPSANSYTAPRKSNTGVIVAIIIVVVVLIIGGSIFSIGSGISGVLNNLSSSSYSYSDSYSDSYTYDDPAMRDDESVLPKNSKSSWTTDDIQAAFSKFPAVKSVAMSSSISKLDTYVDRIDYLKIVLNDDYGINDFTELKKFILANSAALDDYSNSDIFMHNIRVKVIYDGPSEPIINHVKKPCEKYQLESKTSTYTEKNGICYMKSYDDDWYEINKENYSEFSGVSLYINMDFDDYFGISPKVYDKNYHSHLKTVPLSETEKFLNSDKIFKKTV
jgi:hypothetical protein